MNDLKKFRIRVFRMGARFGMVATPLITLVLLVTGQMPLIALGMGIAVFLGFAGLWGLAWILGKYDL